MGRPAIWIPINDIKGLKTLLKEGMSKKDMAAYYSDVLPNRVLPQRIGEHLKRITENE